MKQTIFSNGFFMLVALIAIANLLIYNDWFIWFPGTELTILTQSALPLSGKGWLVPLLWGKLSALTGMKPFLMRLPSVLFFSGTIYLVYRLGRELFGLRRVGNVMVVLAASPLLLITGKIMAGDHILLFFLSGAVLTLFHFLKKDAPKWRYLHLAFLIGALWTHPWVALITMAAVDVALYSMHPQGKRVLLLWHWILFPVVFVVLYLIGGFPFPIGNMVFTYVDLSPGSNLLWQLGILLPWWGPLAAGLWQVLVNVRKGEEWSVLMVALLLAALACGTLFLQFVLALLIGRSIQDMAHPGYPYQRLFKGMAIIALVAGFCLGAFGMLNGFYYLQAAGFRVMMAVCIGFWIPYFISIIGLYSERPGLYRNMAGLASLFGFFFLLVQGGSVLETLRAWQRDVPEQVVESGESRLYMPPMEFKETTLEYYCNWNGVGLVYLEPGQQAYPMLIDSARIEAVIREDLQIDTFPAFGNQWYLIMERK